MFAYGIIVGEVFMWHVQKYKHYCARLFCAKLSKITKRKCITKITLIQAQWVCLFRLFNVVISHFHCCLVSVCVCVILKVLTSYLLSCLNISKSKRKHANHIHRMYNGIKWQWSSRMWLRWWTTTQKRRNRLFFSIYYHLTILTYRWLQWQ